MRLVVKDENKIRVVSAEEMEEGAIGIIRRVTNSGFLGSLVRKSGKNLVFLNESVFDKDSLNVEDANSVRIEVLRKGTTLVIT